MADLRSRARAALAARLRELLPPARLHPDGEHVLHAADALVPTVGPDGLAWALAAIGARARGELRPARSGAVGLHAAWSSTALVASAFAPWRKDPSSLALAGAGPFTEVRLEERLHIPHGGGTPNLDVALDSPGGLVGVESKLTEHLAPRTPRAWRPAYRRPAMAGALRGGWAATFEDLLTGRWVPRHVDAGQLVRHALSLRGSGELVYLYWEPAEADRHPEVAAHRAELAELAARVGDAAPRLRASSWPALLAAWQPLLPTHVAELRRRYEVAVP